MMMIEVFSPGIVIPLLKTKRIHRW